MTPADFQNRFNTDPKTLRHYLRGRWPHEHNAPWVLDEGMVLDALQHFNIPTSSYRPGAQVQKHAAPLPVLTPIFSGPRSCVQTQMTAAQVIDALTKTANTQLPREFPVDKMAAGRPGMYSWWADDVARRVLGASLGATLPPLIYVGQAGATRWPSGTRSNATLGSRIGRQHIRGNAGSSTFRLTISALLLASLHLTLDVDGRLEAASNALVSVWIADHLRVAIAPFDDRDQLGAVEADVVSTLDPPLNLEHCHLTGARQNLSALRRVITRS